MTSMFFQEAKFGLRRLFKERGFSALIVLALGLGLGINATVFTLVYAVLFRGAFDEPHRIMHMGGTNLAKGRDNESVSYLDFRDWQKQSKTFENIAAYQYAEMNLADKTAPPERFQGNKVTWNTFSMLGIKPVVGRDFSPEDENPNETPPVLISYSVWENRYGRDIRINDRPATIIGVIPKGIRFPTNSDFWAPLLSDQEMLTNREHRNLRVLGKLAPNRTLTDA